MSAPIQTSKSVAPSRTTTHVFMGIIARSHRDPVPAAVLQGPVGKAIKRRNIFEGSGEDKLPSSEPRTGGSLYRHWTDRGVEEWMDWKDSNIDSSKCVA